MIDLHCHIIPGVDDGAESLEESIEMAKIAEEERIEKIVATPHLFRGDLNSGDFPMVEEKRQELCRALKDHNIQLEILPGAEVHISHDLIEEIRKNREKLVLNHSSYMLIEFPADHVYAGAKNLLFELMSEGLTPIIAHPERNNVFVHNPRQLYELVSMGALSQANSGSFFGLYGRSVREAALSFLKLNLTHFIASDCHSPRSRAPRLTEAVNRAGEEIGKKNAGFLVRKNPQAVVEDRAIPYLPEPINPKEKEKSFKIRIPDIFKRQ